MKIFSQLFLCHNGHTEGSWNTSGYLIDLKFEYLDVSSGNDPAVLQEALKHNDIDFITHDTRLQRHNRQCKISLHKCELRSEPLVFPLVVINLKKPAISKWLWSASSIYFCFPRHIENNHAIALNTIR